MCWELVCAQEWQLLMFPLARVPFAILGASVSAPVLALQEQGTSQAKAFAHFLKESILLAISVHVKT